MDLKNTPLYPTPPGQVSNLDNPVTLSQAIIVTSSICLGLMIPIASLRLYHRTFVTRAFWWDDGACILAIFGAVGFTATTLSSLNYTGLHQLDIPASEFTEAIAQKHTLVYQMTFGPTMFFTKLSLFLLYLRLFSPSVRIKYLVHLGIALCFIVYGGTTIAQGIFCIPKRGETWRDGMKRQQCQDGRFIGYVVGSFNVVSDFYILILPLPAIWKLNMATRQKIGLCGVFMMGFLACVSTILGLYIRVLMNLKTDIAWYLGWLCMFMIIEVNVGIICGCTPHLVSFFRRYPILLPSLWSLSLRRARSRTSKGSTWSGDPFARRKHSNDAHLETGILGTSARGEGFFINTGDWPSSEEDPREIVKVKIER